MAEAVGDDLEGVKGCFSNLWTFDHQSRTLKPTMLSLPLGESESEHSSRPGSPVALRFSHEPSKLLTRALLGKTDKENAHSGKVGSPVVRLPADGPLNDGRRVLQTVNNRVDTPNRSATVLSTPKVPSSIGKTRKKAATPKPSPRPPWNQFTSRNTKPPHTPPIPQREHSATKSAVSQSSGNTQVQSQHQGQHTEPIETAATPTTRAAPTASPAPVEWDGRHVFQQDATGVMSATRSISDAQSITLGGPFTLSNFRQNISLIAADLEDEESKLLSFINSIVHEKNSEQQAREAAEKQVQQLAHELEMERRRRIQAESQLHTFKEESKRMFEKLSDIPDCVEKPDDTCSATNASITVVEHPVSKAEPSPFLGAVIRRKKVQSGELVGTEVDNTAPVPPRAPEQDDVGRPTIAQDDRTAGVVAAPTETTDVLDTAQSDPCTSQSESEEVDVRAAVPVEKNPPGHSDATARQNDIDAEVAKAQHHHQIIQSLANRLKAEQMQRLKTEEQTAAMIDEEQKTVTFLENKIKQLEGKLHRMDNLPQVSTWNAKRRSVAFDLATSQDQEKQVVKDESPRPAEEELEETVPWCTRNPSTVQQGDVHENEVVKNQQSDQLQLQLPEDEEQCHEITLEAPERTETGAEETHHVIEGVEEKVCESSEVIGESPDDEGRVEQREVSRERSLSVESTSSFEQELMARSGTAFFDLVDVKRNDHSLCSSESVAPGAQQSVSTMTSHTDKLSHCPTDVPQRVSDDFNGSMDEENDNDHDVQRGSFSLGSSPSSGPASNVASPQLSQVDQVISRVSAIINKKKAQGEAKATQKVNAIISSGHRPFLESANMAIGPTLEPKRKLPPHPLSTIATSTVVKVQRTPSPMMKPEKRHRTIHTPQSMFTPSVPHPPVLPSPTLQPPSVADVTARSSDTEVLPSSLVEEVATNGDNAIGGAAREVDIRTVKQQVSASGFFDEVSFCEDSFTQEPEDAQGAIQDPGVLKEYLERRWQATQSISNM